MIAASKSQAWKDLYKYFSHVIDGIGTPIDAGIIDVVVGLNAVGVNTEASCKGHLDHGNAHPWIRIGALGVDDLEEQFRQARLRVQRASGSDHDQAFAEYSEIEQRLKSLHMQEWDKTILLLDAFYKYQLVEYDCHLVVSDFLITGAFFL